MEQPNSDPATTDDRVLREPYSPSWVDWITIKIDDAPPPVWLSYFVLLLILEATFHVLSWLDGSVPAWDLNLEAASLPVWIVFPLIFIHYIDSVSVKSLNAFKGSLDRGESEIQTLSYEISTMPARPTLLVSLIAPAAVLLALATSSALESPASIGGAWIRLSVGWLFFPILIYHTVRQLRLVSRIHEKATQIDLFDLDPLYAFSGLTVRTAVGWIVIINLNIVQNTVLQSGISLIPGSAAWIVVTSLQLLLVTLAFVLPLWGIHRKLANEKARLLFDANQRMKAAIQLLNRRVDAEDVDQNTGIYRTLSSLVIEHQVIEGIPTWPWRPATFRGFLVAVVLPIILWLIQESADRFLDL